MNFNTIVQHYDKYALSYPKTQTFLLLVATYYIAKNTLKYLRKLMPMVKRSLVTRYGSNSWVVLMGGTKGICRELCVQLAREGFNIVIISHCENAMEMFEIANACFGVETKIIEIQDEKDLQRIYPELQELDISLLVNYQEIEFQANHFERQGLNEILSSLRNSLQTLILTKLLFTKLLARRKCRSCIIQVCQTLNSLPYFGLDAANEVFESYILQSLQKQYNQIDFVLVVNRIRNGEKYVRALLDKLRQGECEQREYILYRDILLKEQYDKIRMRQGRRLFGEI